MPTMDTVCFLGDENTLVNFITLVHIEKLDFEKCKERFARFVSDKSKLRWKIREIFGDKYWEEVSI